MTVKWDTTIRDSFQCEYARNYITSYGGTDDPYRLEVRKGRGWLRRAGIDGIVGNDIPFFVYLLSGAAGVAWRKYHEVSCVVAGDISDLISDDEAALICEIEPSLVVPKEGVGSCSPEVTAILDVLEQVGYAMEEAWKEQEEANDEEEIYG